MLQRMQGRPFVGRGAELELLSGALNAAVEGRGSLWFLTGEPGIGKSRLAEELSDRAAARGVPAAFGRSWEAGGAPAYWPWIQVLRALLHDASPDRLADTLGDRVAYLLQILPELRARLAAVPERPPLDTDREHFEVLDAIGGALFAVCPPSGVLVVLEDLHAADASTLAVLEVLAPALRNTKVLLVGTLRDGDVRLSASRDALAAVSLRGRTLPLPRLRRSEVRTYLNTAARHSPDQRACDAVFEVTEGNHAVRGRGGEPARDPQPLGADRQQRRGHPKNLRAVLRRRVQSVTEPAREALAVASVLGREFSGSMLCALAGRSMAQMAEPLNEALEAGLVVEAAPGEYRFSHALLRETLHHDLVDARRTTLHLEAAELLCHRSGEHVLWSEVAHHYLEAGPAGREGGVAACRRAAEGAAAQLAFSEACEWYGRALAALGQDPTTPPAARAELLLLLADAQLHSGALEAGKRTAERAAELARALGDARLFARAALTRGSVLVFARVDPKLVALLSEALAGLDAEPALGAVVAARLAAAEQPSPTPEGPIQKAREALVLANQLGDPRVWLETARYAVSAMMDLAPPSERLVLNREYVRVAEELEQPLEALRGRMRLVFDEFELGNIARAEAYVAEIERDAELLGHPFYTWRVHSFRAMLALFQGNFARAEAEMQEARALGEKARDPNAEKAHVLQRATLWRLKGRYDQLLEMGPELVRQTVALHDLMLHAYWGEALALLGRQGERLRFAGSDGREAALGLGDATILARLVAQADSPADAAFLRELAAKMSAKEGIFVSGGMTGMVWDEPVALVLARCADKLGEVELARARYREAILLAEQAGGHPFACWARLELAEHLARSGPHEPALFTLLAEALEAARRLDMPGVAARAEALQRALSEQSEHAGSVAVAPAPPSLRLERDGELWTLAAPGRLLRLRDSKGIQWLAELLNRPGQEVHVLDLMAPGERRAPSDAGELLDASAIADYRRRLAELGQELSEAEAFNDLARAERASEEREFLERELRRAVGLGNRQRRAGGDAERARINVQRRLKDAIRRIAEQDAELGQELERTVTTGLFCCYFP